MNNVTFLQFVFIINPKYWLLLPRIRKAAICPFQFSFLFLVVSLIHPTINQAIDIHNKINNIDHGT